MRRRRKKPSTGYNPKPKSKPQGKVWSVAIADHYFHGKLAATLRCNGESRGLIQLEDEDEFKWLQAKLLGTQLPKTG